MRGSGVGLRRARGGGGKRVHNFPRPIPGPALRPARPGRARERGEPAGASPPWRSGGRTVRLPGLDRTQNRGGETGPEPDRGPDGQRYAGFRSRRARDRHPGRPLPEPPAATMVPFGQARSSLRLQTRPYKAQGRRQEPSTSNGAAADDCAAHRVAPEIVTRTYAAPPGEMPGEHAGTTWASW